MKRPIVILLVLGLLLGIAGAGAYLYFSQNTTSQPSTEADIAPTPTPKMVLWDDPAGFTMQYPEGIQLNKHDEDKENYAHVELTDPGHPGGVIVWVKDLPKGVADTVSWGKKMSTPSSAISFDTTLGGNPAQKILDSAPIKKMTTGVVYDGVLWYIEAILADEAYWQSVYDAVVSSFVFKPIAAMPDSGSPGGAGDSAAEYYVDEEEVLE